MNYNQNDIDRIFLIYNSFYIKDIQRIILLIKEYRNINLTIDQVKIFWQDYSEQFNMIWQFLPSSDNDIIKLFDSFILSKLNKNNNQNVMENKTDQLDFDL